VVATAAVLRFAGLAHGLRHEPIADEAYFVDAARDVWTSGQLDHRFHEYPGLAVYLVVPAVALFGGEGAAATVLAARALVAACGVLTVVLTWLLGRRVCGHGILAAALVAVCPIDVRVAHEYRPDVVLGTAAALALLAFTRLGPRAGLWSGAAVGLATAIKFSGALLGPAWALGLPWPRKEAFRLAALGLAASLVTFALLSPYTLLNLEDFRSGAGTQLSYHYEGGGDWARIAWSYVLAWVKGFGAAGLLLAVAGGVLVLRSAERRRFAPLVALPLLALLAFSTSPIRHERFLLMASPALAVLAGLAVTRLREVRPGAGLVVALGVLVGPAATSVEIVSALRQPSTADDTLDWLQREMPAGSRVLGTVAGFGLDPRAFDVRSVTPRQVTPRSALEWDVVVLFEDQRTEWRTELPVVHRVAPRTPWSGLPVVVLRAPDALRPRYAPLSATSVTASSSPEMLAWTVDGDPATAWSVAEQAGVEWVEVRLARPARLGRLVLDQGPRGDHYPRNLRLLTSEDGTTFEPAVFERGRLPAADQRGEARSEVLLLDAPGTLALRIEQVGRRPKPWAVAELRVEELLEAPSWAKIAQRRIRR
jgi:hypothetical protein